MVQFDWSWVRSSCLVRSSKVDGCLCVLAWLVSREEKARWMDVFSMLEMKFFFSSSSLAVWFLCGSDGASRLRIECCRRGNDSFSVYVATPLRDSFSHAAKCKSCHLLARSPLHPPLLTAATSSLVNGARGLHFPPHFSADPAIRTRCH